MASSLAINIGANTSLPGFRGPIYPDRSFVYVPIPERKPTRPAVTVPTYRDLNLPIDIPEQILDTRVHLDPEFIEYPFSEYYTYGDEHGVKAGPIAELSTGDYLLFYATLSRVDPISNMRVASEWGAFIIGLFKLQQEPVTDCHQLDFEGTVFQNNAHVKRKDVDARVLVAGEPDESGLLDKAIALSDASAGSNPNEIVTELSADSGKGPWWRRPLRFDDNGTNKLLAVVRSNSNFEES